MHVEKGFQEEQMNAAANICLCTHFTEIHIVIQIQRVTSKQNKTWGTVMSEKKGFIGINVPVYGFPPVYVLTSCIDGTQNNLIFQSSTSELKLITRSTSKKRTCDIFIGSRKLWNWNIPMMKPLRGNIYVSNLFSIS